MSAESNSAESNRPHNSQNHGRFPHPMNKIERHPLAYEVSRDDQLSTLCYSPAYNLGQPMHENSDLYVVCKISDPLSASAHSYMEDN